MTQLLAPALLTDEYETAGFDCGVPSLDDWLKRRALANQASGASRTYVVAEEARVLGYYCLASGAVSIIDAPSNVRRNMPDPIPMAVLGRFAIDRIRQGKGLGVALLQDAVIRTAQAAQIIGVRGILVHAISSEAALFYKRHGFVPSPNNPLTLVMSLKGMGPRG